MSGHEHRNPLLPFSSSVSRLTLSFMICSSQYISILVAAGTTASASLGVPSHLSLTSSTNTTAFMRLHLSRIQSMGSNSTSFKNLLANLDPAMRPTMVWVPSEHASSILMYLMP